MFRFTDQLNQTINLEARPKKVISLVPSQSELLWDLGLQAELIGITKYCLFPKQMFSTVQHIGGTKKLNIKKIVELKPDLIIGNKEENDASQIKELQSSCEVWMSDIYNFDDMYKMINSMGEIFDKQQESIKMVTELKTSLGEVFNIFEKQKVAYFVWNKPMMVAANNTFINHVLEFIGFENAFAHLTRYPVVSLDLLKEIRPDVCLLSSEPFPFKERHVLTLKEQLPDSHVLLVNGEMFSWYGSRLLHLSKYLIDLDLKKATL
jgi:ABC-type Fe3+-hydroxamate transport system substrate-binding protein